MAKAAAWLLGKPNSEKATTFSNTRMAVASGTPRAAAPAKEPLPVALERVAAALAAHRPAQALGLAGGEPGQRDRHLEHLILEHDHPQGVVQHRLEQRVVVGRLEAGIGAAARGGA